MKQKRDEFSRTLDKRAHDRQVELLDDMAESSAKLAEISSKLEVVKLKLGLVGQLRTFTDNSVLPEITIVRKGGQKWGRGHASEDSELEPGDVIDVAFRSEDLTGLTAH
jgi:polysaccharide export outer membrane protein